MHQTKALNPKSLIDFSEITFFHKALVVLLGSAVLWMSAKTQAPLGLVKVSLQPTVIILFSFFMGAPMALATVALYLFEGAMGLPVFQSTPERGLGLAYMVGPTGGYLVGFLLASVVPSLLMSRLKSRHFMVLFTVTVATDILMIQAPGALYLSTFIGMSSALTVTSTFFVPSLIKGVMTASIVKLASRFIR